jgi:Trypsin-co-occurring domain 1
MNRLVEFPLRGGGMVLVEIAVPPEQEGNVRAGRARDAIEKAQTTFEDSLSKVRVVAQAVVDQLTSLADSPDEVSASFGLKVSAEAGVILASGTVEANYTVTLKWNRSKSAQPQIGNG